MSRVVFSTQAEEDLLDITFYIAQDDPKAAVRFIEKIEQTCSRIAASPEIGRLRPELASKVRSFPVDRYVIFYVPTKRGIDVLRVLHGARDIPSIF